MNRINPDKDLKKTLAAVQSPSRYTGGEFGQIINDDAIIRAAICFPDLYEIGMSNSAIKILYSLINAVPGVSAERVFAPAPDFENELASHSFPLYTLESGTPLLDCDLIAFSVGYELNATNIITVLKSGGINIHSEDRRDRAPVVIAGGPSIVNPLPLSNFIDAFFIGEAEGIIPDLLASLCRLKQRGANRGDIINRIREENCVWYKGKNEDTKRAVWNGFADTAAGRDFPVPSSRIVQDHGSIEIMRGCPQGCRFCQAGYIYRPCRMKHPEKILEEAEILIRRDGYRRITLSSLSSGDYIGINELINELNDRYSELGVSFSLPSLKIDSFSLGLLNRVSSVRKSGLTFAVETPTEKRQLMLNKRASLDRIIEIIESAKQSGWRSAKFYFMIGLPGAPENEHEEISEFVHEIVFRTKIQVNVNIGTFIPKPHTPFQWTAQISEEESLKRIMSFKHSLKTKKIRFGYHSPFHSMLEGIISRGDERVGRLIEFAHENGARLDAWEEYTDRALWHKLLKEAGWDISKEILRSRKYAEPLPWDCLSSGVTKAYLIKESKKALEGLRTGLCEEDCKYPCGICGTANKLRMYPGDDKSNKKKLSVKNRKDGHAVKTGREIAASRVLMISYKKKNEAKYISHTGLISVFERAFLRAQLPVYYTQGYNPKPRLQFAHPLSVGIDGEEEICSIMLYKSIQPEKMSNDKYAFLTLLSRQLPDGLEVNDVMLFPAYIEGRKLPSVMKLLTKTCYHTGYGLESNSDDRIIQSILGAGKENDDIRVSACSECGGADICLQGKTASKSIIGIIEAAAETHPLKEGLEITRTGLYAGVGESDCNDYFSLYRSFLPDSTGNP